MPGLSHASSRADRVASRGERTGARHLGRPACARRGTLVTSSEDQAVRGTAVLAAVAAALRIARDSAPAASRLDLTSSVATCSDARQHGAAAPELVVEELALNIMCTPWYVLAAVARHRKTPFIRKMSAPFSCSSVLIHAFAKRKSSSTARSIPTLVTDVSWKWPCAWWRGVVAAVDVARRRVAVLVLAAGRRRRRARGRSPGRRSPRRGRGRRRRRRGRGRGRADRRGRPGPARACARAQRRECR